MYWLLIPAGLFFFREKIAQILAPILPQVGALRAAFFLHCGLLLTASLYIIPIEFVGFGFIKRPAYLMSMWFTTISSIFTLTGNYGPPPTPQGLSIKAPRESFQKFSVQLQPWLQKATMSADFPWLFFSLIFLTAYPTLWALAILGRRSLWSVCTVCARDHPESRLFKLFASTWQKLKAREAEVLDKSALAEVMLGLWLVVSIALPTRQILTCFLYWNYLRIRFQVPRSKPAHTKAWMLLEQKTGFLWKIGPLCKLRDLAVGWFTKSP